MAKKSGYLSIDAALGVPQIIREWNDWVTLYWRKCRLSIMLRPEEFDEFAARVSAEAAALHGSSSDDGPQAT